MLELIRKSLLLGLGAATVSRDRVRESLQTLVDEGKITAEEAEQLSSKLVDTGEEELERYKGEFTQALGKVLDGMDVARRSRVDELQRQIDELTNRLDLLEDRFEREGK